MNSTEREPVMHELKCDRGPFQDILSGHKKAEVRRDDRDFQVGDTLNLLETVHTAEEMRAEALLEFTGGQALKAVTHVQRGYGLPDGIVVLSFDEVVFVQAACAGPNFGCTDGVSHSTECQAAHDAAAAEPEYCWSRDNEDFTSGTLDDLLDSHADDLAPGMTVYFGTAVRPKTTELYDADDVIDMIGDRAGDIGGDYADGFPNVDKAAVAELDALLKGWIEKHCMPTPFYRVANVREHILTKDDFGDREQENG